MVKAFTTARERKREGKRESERQKEGRGKVREWREEV